jgi:hypothetical protein
MTWKKGESGNPGGKPKGHKELRMIAEGYVPEAIEKLYEIMNGRVLIEEKTWDNKKKRYVGTGKLVKGAAAPDLQYQAAIAIIERALGKPVQPIAGSDDDAPLQIERIERVIVQMSTQQPRERIRRNEPVTIEHDPQERPRIQRVMNGGG